MTPPCHAPISDDELLEYWIDAADEATANRLEEHLFSCPDCGGTLFEIER